MPDLVHDDIAQQRANKVLGKPVEHGDIIALVFEHGSEIDVHRQAGRGDVGREPGQHHAHRVRAVGVIIFVVVHRAVHIPHHG